jgi:cell division transport system permease protein
LAAVIRHAIEEGIALLRRRAVVSLVFVLSLSIPLALAGFTAALSQWAQPLLALEGEAVAVRVLLHPRMDLDQRSGWIVDQTRKHPEWTVEEVSEDELADRLTLWFPYLADLLEGDMAIDLPPLIEIVAPDPEEVAQLVRGPAVIAVGPTSSVHRALGSTAKLLAWFLGSLSIGLLASALILAATWIHLEIYRHGDEITIMRLVGATEASIRSPFFVVAALPGLAAGLAAAASTFLMVNTFARAVSVLGLQQPVVPAWVITAEIGVGFVLPTAAAANTHARHPYNDGGG